MAQRTLPLASALGTLAAAVLTAGCAAAPPPAVPVEDMTDRTAELQARLDALRPGDTLELDAGVTYPHSGVLRVTVPDVTIDGNGATLRATRDETSAVRIEADGVTVTDLTLAAPPEGIRRYGEDQHKLVVSGDNATLTGVRVDGSAGAGVYLTGATNFSLRDVEVRGSRADGVHMTGGSAYGHVESVRTSRTGDDGVAVVSYDADAAPCHDIVVRDVEVDGTTWGRGITVVGGEKVRVSRFTVRDTSSAGLYVATEGAPFFTRSVRDVVMSDGTITGANHDTDIEQGAALVYAGNKRGRSVRGVTIADVEIAATSASAKRDVAIVDETGAGTKALGGITLRDIRLTGDELAPFYTNVPAAAFSLQEWTRDGRPLQIDPQ